MTARPSSPECRTTGSRRPSGASISWRFHVCIGPDPNEKAAPAPVRLTVRLTGSMELAVDRFELGPIGTNCYVVRAARGAEECVVIDPGADAAALRLELAGMGTRCAAILVTHTHWDHIGGVADFAEGTGAPVHVSATEAPVLQRPDDFYASLGVHIRSYDAEVLLEGHEELHLAG